jgi:hypothetical protein
MITEQKISDTTHDSETNCPAIAFTCHMSRLIGGDNREQRYRDSEAKALMYLEHRDRLANCPFAPEVDTSTLEPARHNCFAFWVIMLVS